MTRPTLRRCCARCLNVILKLLGEGVEVRNERIPRGHIAHGFNGELLFLVDKEEDGTPERSTD